MQLSLCGLTLLLAVATLQLQFLSASPMERLPGAPEPSVPSGMQSTPSLKVSKKPDPEAKGGGLQDGKGQVVSALPQAELLEMFKNLDTDFGLYNYWKGKGEVLLTRDTLQGYLAGAKNAAALKDLMRFLHTYVNGVLAGILEFDVSNIAKADKAMRQYLLDSQGRWSDDSLYKSAVATYTMLHSWGEIASAMGQVAHQDTFSHESVIFKYDDKKPLTQKIKAIYKEPKMTAWKEEFDVMYKKLRYFKEIVFGILFAWRVAHIQAGLPVDL